MNKKYCYLMPVFPENAFIYITFLYENEKVISPYVFNKIYTDINKLCFEAIDLNKSVVKDNRWTMKGNGMLIPIHLKRLYPLKKEYWKNPTFDFEYIDRIIPFYKAINKLDLYDLLVTPSFYNTRTRKWILSAVLPFPKSGNYDLVEKFLLNSKWPVEEKANSAAIYSFNDPLRFNWQTQEKSFFDREISSPDYKN